MRRKLATRRVWKAGSASAEVGKRAAMGSARTARRMPRGTRMVRTRLSMAEAVRETVSRSPAMMALARRGTMVAARAPPTTTSYRTLGIWLAVA